MPSLPQDTEQPGSQHPPPPAPASEPPNELFDSNESCMEPQTWHCTNVCENCRFFVDVPTEFTEENPSKAQPATLDDVPAYSLGVTGRQSPYSLKVESQNDDVKSQAQKQARPCGRSAALGQTQDPMSIVSVRTDLPHAPHLLPAHSERARALPAGHSSASGTPSPDDTIANHRDDRVLCASVI